jgi:1-acyl-sn-glycerol-3-phosphate acyltransferase
LGFRILDFGRRQTRRKKRQDRLRDLVARHGRNLVFFSEGAFTRRAGLSGFYLGAFKVAAEAKLSISPSILRGTRSMLRADQWFPKWTPISVYIGEAISPRGTDFASVLWLRDAVRDVVLAHCGEPDLGALAKPAPPHAAA